VFTVCHSEDEQPFSLLSRSNFLRCKEARRNFVTQALKVGDDLLGPEAEVSTDVLGKYDAWFNFANNAMDVGP
jgi:hypothetical protein